MSDRYADLRAALPVLIEEARREGGTNHRAQMIINLLADFEEGSARALYESSVAEAAIEHVKNLEAERDRLREALLWNAGALQACCSEGIREASNITIAAETKCFAEILDMADAALAQEQGESK